LKTKVFFNILKGVRGVKRKGIDYSNFTRFDIGKDSLGLQSTDAPIPKKGKKQ